MTRKEFKARNDYTSKAKSVKRSCSACRNADLKVGGIYCWHYLIDGPMRIGIRGGCAEFEKDFDR